MKITIQIVCIIFFPAFSYGQNYNVGDTLTVVALEGLNLRMGPSQHDIKIAGLENGEKVIIMAAEDLPYDTIFGFVGKWVFVNRISGDVKGFVFDAFISKYSTVENLLVFEKQISRTSLADNVEFLPGILEQYALQNFEAQGCETEYYNGSDGEGSHSFHIIELSGDNKLIKHRYWEGTSSELELTNARSSEIYYLVLNLLKFLPTEIYKIDDAQLRTPEHSALSAVNDQWGNYLVRIVKKKKEKISIFFYFPCC